jgi:catechol-2,3-dioxygenase
VKVEFDGVCEVVLESSAPERMVDFYERIGLRPLSNECDRAWLAVGPRCRIGIWSPGEKEHQDRGGSHVHFALSAVDGQLDATIAWLREADWDFEGPVTHDGGDRSVYLFDPEGNRLEIWDYYDGDEAADAPG